MPKEPARTIRVRNWNSNLLSPAGEIEVDLLFIDSEAGEVDPEIEPAADDLSESWEPEMGRDRECHLPSWKTCVTPPTRRW